MMKFDAANNKMERLTVKFAQRMPTEHPLYLVSAINDLWLHSDIRHRHQLPVQIHLSEICHNYKYSVLTIDMKTKFIQHVPRINISIWHKTCNMWYCDIITNTHLNMKTKFVHHVPRTNISMLQTQWHSHDFSHSHKQRYTDS